MYCRSSERGDLPLAFGGMAYGGETSWRKYILKDQLSLGKLIAAIKPRK